MVKNTKNARQIFEFHKIWHILFNSQPILMNKSLKLTYGVRLQFIFTNTVRFFASICHSRPRFNVFITGPFMTSFDQFFLVLVLGSQDLGHFGTGPSSGLSKKGEKKGPDQTLKR